ncbi:uncharacterized protein LOC111365663 [Olea europaea var. sylvestris]|uniref:uncharacterized protein LOC111365663 n=1 Tax=Olea europaea var. sylvestris TaxID=158386 RepID=UPI000C1D09E8|nr:uncharacterized protein LOC111365663 [Olea europaea var. sylvestris]
MAQLRYDVAMLRAGLGDLHAEVVAIRGDIAGLRGTSDYRDGGGSGGTGHYQDGGGDGGTSGYRDGGTGGYQDGGGDGGVGGYQGGGGQMGYVDSSWPSVVAFDSFLDDTMGMEERERIPVVEGVPVRDIPEDVEGVPEEERVPEVGVPVQGIPEDVEGASESEVEVEVEVDRVLELEVVPVHGIPGDVEGAPEEERVPEVEVVPEKTPDSPVVVFVSEEVAPTAGEGVVPMAGEMEIPEAHEERTMADDMVERVVGKRPRVPSQYVLSPFTAEAKRRRFVDGTHPNLFREVDHAKWKAFETEWRALQPG